VNAVEARKPVPRPDPQIAIVRLGDTTDRALRKTVFDVPLPDAVLRIQCLHQEEGEDERWYETSQCHFKNARYSSAWIATKFPKARKSCVMRPYEPDKSIAFVRFCKVV